MDEKFNTSFGVMSCQGDPWGSIECGVMGDGIGKHNRQYHVTCSLGQVSLQNPVTLRRQPHEKCLVAKGGRETYLQKKHVQSNGTKHSQ